MADLTSGKVIALVNLLAVVVRVEFVVQILDAVGELFVVLIHSLIAVILTLTKSCRGREREDRHKQKRENTANEHGHTPFIKGSDVGGDFPTPVPEEEKAPGVARQVEPFGLCWFAENRTRDQAVVQSSTRYIKRFALTSSGEPRVCASCSAPDHRLLFFAHSDRIWNAPRHAHPPGPARSTPLSNLRSRVVGALVHLTSPSPFFLISPGRVDRRSWSTVSPAGTSA